MFIIQLFLAWYLLYLVFHWLFDTGNQDKGASSGETEQNEHAQDRSSYVRNTPDALRPDIEPDEFEPTDFI